MAYVPRIRNQDAMRAIVDNAAHPLCLYSDSTIYVERERETGHLPPSLPHALVSLSK